jgi:hypothetical protein
MQNELDNGVIEDNYHEHEVDATQPHIISLGKGQKIAVFVLAFFTIVLLFVGTSNIGSKIKQPIGQYTEDTSSQDKQTNNSASTFASDDSDTSLKTKDTDGDGLNDWDELNVYKTSPYLEDSDSDGFLDGSEISTNNNPNCPNGKDCGIFMDGDKINNDSTNTSVPISNTPNTSSGDIKNVQTSNDDLQKILDGDSDAKTLREALIGYGVDKAMLDQISDEELLKGYQESLNGE